MLSLRKVVLLQGVLLFVIGAVAQPAATPRQPDSLAIRITSSLQRWYRKYPAEKVFVHTSQEMYSSGETIWYKVYATAYGKPSGLSGVVYIQLSDTAGNIVTQSKLRLANGSAHGDITIDPKQKSGWYRLSAFTAWMLNFDREAFYSQKIYIHNSASPAGVAESAQTEKKNYHIDFFPEGGDLVSGNPARVAFKAYADDGTPSAITGVITDNSGKTIAQLTTVHSGMGDFTLEPSTGDSYSATVRFGNGFTTAVKLPAVKPGGFSLQARHVPGALRLQVALSAQQKGIKRCLLSAVQNSGVVNTFPLQVKPGFNEFALPDDGFSTGILRLTLFDDQGLPIAERLLFINRHDLQISPLKADTLSFAAHAYNAFSVSVKDAGSQPVKGSFSVSVTDGSVFNQAPAQNIYSALLLSPELRGNIYDPGYYFQNQDDSLARQLDLVMLTNGWRHFSWQQILNNKSLPLKYPVEHSLYLAGKIDDYSPAANQVANEKLIIFNHDSTKFLGYATPDSTGRFILKDFNHPGLSDVYMQASDKKGRPKKAKAELLPVLADSLRKAKSDRFYANESPGAAVSFGPRAQTEERARAFANTVELKQVDVKASRVSATDKLIAEHVNPKYTSNREFTLDLVNNFTVNMPLIDYIRGKFPNLAIVSTGGSVQFIYRGGNTLGIPGSSNSKASSNGGPQTSAPPSSGDDESLPYFYLNDGPVQYDDIKDITLSDLALIRFLPPPVWFAPFNGGGSGAIMLYSKNQADEIRQIPGVSAEYDHFIFNGYTVTREFSTPDYVTLKNAGQLDDRITLYWAHDLEPDSNGILKFHFSNTDITKKYNIVVQGMDEQGRLLYFQKTFQ